MELALGVLGWAPSEFREATPAELSAAVVGRMRTAGPRTTNREIGDDGVPLAPGCTREGSLRVLEQMRQAKEGR